MALKSIWETMVQNAGNTPLVKGVQAGLQKYGENRQQGIPLMRGGSGNSVINSMQRAGNSYAYAPEPQQNMSREIMSREVNTNNGSNNVELGGSNNIRSGGSGSIVGSGDSGLSAEEIYRQQLERQRESQLNALRGELDAGNRYYDDAYSALQGRRDLFNQNFQNTNDDIQSRYGQDRATLQETAAGSDARLTNAALAQGMGGSGLQELLRRNEASKMRSLGQTRENRQSNERGNQATLDENNLWARGREDEINRGRDDLQNWYRQGTQTTLDNFQNSLGNLIAQAQAQRQALQMAGANISGYNPTMAAVSDAGINPSTLNTAFNALMGGVQSAPEQNTNQQFNQMALLDQDRRLRGLV